MVKSLENVLIGKAMKSIIIADEKGLLFNCCNCGDELTEEETKNNAFEEGIICNHCKEEGEYEYSLLGLEPEIQTWVEPEIPEAN